MGIPNFEDQVTFEGLHSQGLRKIRGTYVVGLEDQEVNVSCWLEE